MIHIVNSVRILPAVYILTLFLVASLERLTSVNTACGPQADRATWCMTMSHKSMTLEGRPAITRIHKHKKTDFRLEPDFHLYL